MKALIFSILTVTAVFIVMLLTMVATGESVAIISHVVKQPLMLGVFTICIVITWFAFRSIGREIWFDGWLRFG